MCTSLQAIVNVQDRSRLEMDIQALFKHKPYPRFELAEFYRHPLYQQSEHFNFFLDILEEWNRKIEKQELSNCCDTLFHKNAFLFNSLRNSTMQAPNSATKVLAHLYDWFNGTRNRNVKTAERRPRVQEQDEDWLVRNTFKSNLPAEIDLYRRRVCCRLRPDKENAPVPNLAQDKSRKVKTECCNEDKTRELQVRRIAKIENEIVRFQRQAQELATVQKHWKAKRMRQQEISTKNYYRVGFSHSKTFFPSRRKSRDSTSTTTVPFLMRSKTSQGLRSTQKESIRLSEGNQQPYKKLSSASREPVAFQQFEEVRLSDIAGLTLVNNPQETKIRKKKRAIK